MGSIFGAAGYAFEPGHIGGVGGADTGEPAQVAHSDIRAVAERIWPPSWTGSVGCDRAQGNDQTCITASWVDRYKKEADRHYEKMIETACAEREPARDETASSIAMLLHKEHNRADAMMAKINRELRAQLLEQLYALSCPALVVEVKMLDGKLVTEHVPFREMIPIPELDALLEDPEDSPYLRCETYDYDGVSVKAPRTESPMVGWAPLREED